MTNAVVLMQIPDWNYVYDCGELQYSDHYLNLETLMRYIIDNDVQKFYLRTPKDDIPRERDIFSEFFFVPEGSPREYGWFDFPQTIDLELWEKIIDAH